MFSFKKYFSPVATGLTSMVENFMTGLCTNLPEEDDEPPPDKPEKTKKIPYKINYLKIINFRVPPAAAPPELV